MTQKSNELAKAVRFALALSAGAGAAFSAQPVQAQDDTGKAEKLETIEVVGSRIKRTDVETSQPVFVLERQDLQRTGLTSIGDILQHIATNGATLNTTFNNGGTGETRINLRDLGSQRTLVLVNGRRWVTGASLAGVGGSVDLNTIPVAIVERVEVLKDGASSIYGSDAIAGVVNITTRSTYDGAEASGYLGENEEGDGRIESYDFTIGANSEKANVVMNVSYVKQEPIFAGDREISATPTANIPGNNSNVNASSSTPFGRFFITGQPGSVTFDPATGGYKPYNGNVDGFNFAPDNYLQTPQERTSLYVQARYNLTDSVAFRTEALYNQRRSALQLAASPLTLGAAFGIPIAIEPGQEFNPFDGVLNRVQYRPSNEFPRLFASDVDTWHFGAGFEGQFGLWDRNWSWDANYSYSLNETNNVTNGLVNIPNLIAGLQPDCNADNGCVPLDVFRGTSGFTQQMADSILFVAHDQLESELWNYSANITGDLFELPAGPLGMAAGYEYRRQQGFDSPDALISSGASSGNIRQPTSGGYALNEFYAEFNVPIVKDLAFAELLEMNLAVRYSDYSNFGNTTNPKAGFRWKPFADLLVRGNWSKGFRAPNISELFAGNGDSFPDIVDPCSDANIGNLSPAAQQRCLSGFAGVAPVQPGYEQANAQIRITVGGNPNLEPETSITKTLGMVYSPSWASGLDLYLDWYNIRLSSAVGIRTGQFIVNDCYLNANAASCATIERVAPGDIADLFAGAQNLPGGLETEGYDFTATYKMETEYGKFTFNWDSTYVAYFGELGQPDRLDELSDGTLAGGNTAGTYLVFDPRWRVRSNLTTNWSFGDFGATIGMRYYSGVDEPCIVPDEFLDLCTDPDHITDLDGDGIGDFNPQNHLGSRTYVDLQGTWDTPWNGRITVGVNNVTDRDPPFAYSAFANTFDPQYPVPGRFWYVMYMQKF